MPVERFNLILSVYVLLRRDNQILLLRRKNTGFEDGNYGLVAGHVDGNEASSVAMQREALEEAGIIISSDNLRFVHFMHRSGADERADVFFEAWDWDGEVLNKEPDKCDDLSWFDIDDLPANTIPYIRRVIELYTAKVIYSQWGW
jgi:8-oxo-dGTP diphosphatase